MEEKSDLLRLASLAKLASPSHRRSTPKHDSNNIIPDNQPIVRCECGSLNQDDEMIQCCICGCMSHINCVNDDIENINEWTCKFCQESDTNIFNME